MNLKPYLASLIISASATLPVMAQTNSHPLQTAAVNNVFAYDLYAKLKSTEGNLFFSPLSVSTALAMTYAGAKGNTAEQMQKTLHFPASQHDTHAEFAALLKHFDEVQHNGAVQIDMANSLWPQQGAALLESYLTLVKQTYDVSVTPVDYRHAEPEARARINEWVEKKTHGKIVNPIAKLSPDNRLVLVNAVYFKGSWESPFKPEQTHDAPFFTGDLTLQTSLMEQTKWLPYAAPDGIQIVKFPYQGNQLSMTVILPVDKTPAGLKKLESQLTETQVALWDEQLRPTQIQVFLPKFKLEWGTASLAKPLARLGMRDAFLLGKADFSGINGNKELFIGDVLHKAFIAVDEKGTEAAATTVIAVVDGAALTPRHPPVFRADHPFLFLIQDNATGSVLFMGRVMNPTGQ
ncbi:MAG: serpin family protein [Burkholderiaceae bacterium]|nr:serpin family protein [Burkholderiaceae bacterium]